MRRKTRLFPGKARTLRGKPQRISGDRLIFSGDGGCLRPPVFWRKSHEIAIYRDHRKREAQSSNRSDPRRSHSILSHGLQVDLSLEGQPRALDITPCDMVFQYRSGRDVLANKYGLSSTESSNPIRVRFGSSHAYTTSCGWAFVSCDMRGPRSTNLVGGRGHYLNSRVELGSGVLDLIRIHGERLE
jgi:hypothetical protein